MERYMNRGGDSGVLLKSFRLKELSLFRHVAAESIEGVLERCKLVELGKDDILMRKNDANGYLYIILQGELSVRLDSVDGDTVIVLGRGETVGEMSVIDHKGVSAYVCATSDCKLLAMDEGTLWELVNVSHAAACNLLSILTSRLRNANIVISERMKLEHDFHMFGTMDSLTGLHNRHWLDNILPRLIRRYSRACKPLSLIMTDIDHFRDFNTLYGHITGDYVIHSVARAISDHLRPSELAARYGGDEFVIVMPGVSLENARRAAERLQRIVAEISISLPDMAPVVTPTISIGIAEYRSGDSAEQLVAAADAAMFRAKNLGRDALSE